MNAKEYVVKACEGTPIIDAHLVLNLGKTDGSQNAEDVVLFIQYKHSKLESKTTVKVSDMIQACKSLDERLKLCHFQSPWLFLWITNRKIDNDVKNSDSRLLWVGREQFVKHAPLIGRRGLVTVEPCRRNDDN